MAEDTVTMEVSKEFLEWWNKLPCSNDKVIMFIAWSAWRACMDKYNN